MRLCRFTHRVSSVLMFWMLFMVPLGGIAAVPSVLYSYPQERVYLHLDRPVYHPGDTLYYKIYATIGDGLDPDTLSTTLYVQLLDASGTLMQSQKKQLKQGLGAGTMELSAGYEPGLYRIRAFTNWMRNFGTEPQFEKFITLSRPFTGKARWHLMSSMNAGPEWDTLRMTLHLTDEQMHPKDASFEYFFAADGMEPVIGALTTDAQGSSTIELLMPPDSGRLWGRLSLSVGDSTQVMDVSLDPRNVRVHFFPEGGHWVAGIPCRVAFKITDSKGAGLPATGVVRNAQHEVVASFSTFHKGMGFFWLTPRLGESYSAVITPDPRVVTGISPEGIVHPLPAVDSVGYVMEVDGTNSRQILVQLHQGGIHYPEQLGLVVWNGGQPIWRSSFRMSKSLLLVPIPGNKLPTGVSQITLYGPDGNPLCERLIFVNHQDDLRVTVFASRDTFAPREPVYLNLLVTDSGGNPVQGSFSVSVTDQTQVCDTSRFGDNILTHLLLTSEIRGIIEDPGYYFNADSPQKQTALECLLLSQGWRKYQWRWPDATSRARYPVERGLRISGTILDKATRKPVGKEEVTLLLDTGKEKWADNRFTDDSGHFSFISDHYGAARMYFVTQQAGMNVDRAFALDPGEPPFSKPSPESLSQSFYQSRTLLDQERRAQTLPISEHNPDIARIIELEPFELRTRKNVFRQVLKAFAFKPVAELEALAEVSLDIPAILESLRDSSFAIETVRDFVRYAYPEIFTRGRPILFLTDSWESLRGAKPIPMRDIHAYYKMIVVDSYGAAFPYIWRGDSDGALPTHNDDIVINLYAWPDGLNRYPTTGIRAFSTEGYAREKEFFSPDYSVSRDLSVPDTRATLLWAPQVETDAEGRAVLTFYNSDKATQLGVNVQGLGRNAAGVTHVGAKKVTLGH
jgi:hypothetical protein